MVGKKRLKKFNISNKIAYVLIAIFSFILIGVGVYAIPSTFGHSAGEIAFSSCSFGQLFGMTSSGWGCLSSSIIDSRFSVTTSGLCYTAPSSCSAVPTSCFASQYTGVTISDCSTLQQSNLDTICSARCSSDYGRACDGDTTSCSGGSYINYVGEGYCEGGGYISCSCYGSGEYMREVYIPAGQRCI
jgi:hypothetical protein